MMLLKAKARLGPPALQKLIFFAVDVKIHMPPALWQNHAHHQSWPLHLDRTCN